MTKELILFIEIQKKEMEFLVCALSMYVIRIICINIIKSVLVILHHLMYTMKKEIYIGLLLFVYILYIMYMCMHVLHVCM